MSPIPSRELKEKIRHGNQLFPIAGYLWAGGEVAENVNLHWHSEIEIIRVLRGNFTLQVNLDEIPLHAGNLVLIPANMLHGMILPTDCIEDALLFNAKAIALSSFDEVEKDILEALSSGKMPLPPIITREHALYPQISTLMDEAFTCLKDNSPAARLRVKARLLEILALIYDSGLLERHLIKPSARHDDAEDKLKSLLAYINDHYTEELSVNAAATRLHFTKPYFCRFFKKATGMSFVEYVNDLRLRRAAHELVQGQRDIIELAGDYGFANVSYFYRLFKQKFKTTPQAYRKTHRLP